MAKDIFVKSIFDNCRICMACHLYAPYFVLSAYPFVYSMLDNILFCFFFVCMNVLSSGYLFLIILFEQSIYNNTHIHSVSQ